MFAPYTTRPPKTIEDLKKEAAALPKTIEAQPKPQSNETKAWTHVYFDVTLKNGEFLRRGSFYKEDDDYYFTFHENGKFTHIGFNENDIESILMVLHTNGKEEVIRKIK